MTTEPLRFHLHVAPRSTTVRPASNRVEVKTHPLSTVIIAGTPGRQGFPGPPGEGAPIYGEEPFGPLDGVNTTFTTFNDFRPGTTALYLNGLREDNYTESGLNTIVLEDPPGPLDKLRIDYLLA